MNIFINSSRVELSDTAIRTVEQSLATTFPADYRAFIGKHNLSPIASNRVVSGNQSFNISYFFGVGSESRTNLVDQFSIYESRIPKDTRPIAMAGGGNLILLNTANGSVLFWDHESEGRSDAGELWIASNFDNFLSMIEAYTPEIPTDVTVNSVEFKTGFASKFKDYLL